jgi:Xaa-Pro aminopeptidase
MTDEDPAETAEITPEGATEIAPNAASHDIPVPDHVRKALSENWGVPTSIPHPARADAAASASAHRAALSSVLPGEAIVVPAGAVKVRANDTEYPFRAASAFAWLTAETSADAVLVMTPQNGSHTSTLYITEYARPGEIEYFTDRLRGAIWVGGVPTEAETADRLSIRVRDRRQLDTDLAPWREKTNVALLKGFDLSVDALLPNSTPTPLSTVLDGCRLTKDDWEIARLQEACDATTRGFEDVVRELPMVLAQGGKRGERWLEGTFWRRARLEGNEVGYGSIIGAGAHGTVLHWWRNDGDITPGQLLLADMGIETTSLYTADVTRTMPVNGKWTPIQRKVYNAVREAQEAGIAEVKAGADFLAAHHAATWVLADHLHSWGILPVTADVSCSKDVEQPGAGAHRRYTLHGVSHMLGIDVHDCSDARDEEYRDGKLAAGYVLTVEPGLYFQEHDLGVSAEYRGIAVRIEDDIVATDGAPVNLSAALPRDADEISAWMRDVQSTAAIL